MKICILSLDGGGIRGIIPATILAHLEAELQKKTGNENLRIIDFFDLIAGTSTGGILACLYLTPSEPARSLSRPGKSNIRPKYTAIQIRDLYRDMGPLLFHKSLKYKLVSGFGLFKSRYCEESLIEHCRRYFGDSYVSDVMKDCLITSYELSTRKALLFSLYNVKKYGDAANYRLADIARATSAAPTYFSPALIYAKDNTSRHLVDGGVYANNPAMCALVEAVKLWPDLDVKDYCMLSVGTGKTEKSYEWEKTHRYGFIRWLEPIIDILTSSVAETVDFQMQQLFSSNNVPQSYIRIEPPLLASDPRMDNASEKNIRALLDAAESYIDNNKVLLDNIVSLLAKSFMSKGTI
jgi:patatin-like phospholipase/acyl hydrolase